MGATSRWVVYLHTFPATGKSYVGQVKCTPGEPPADAMRRRWLRHVSPSELRAKKCQAMARAIVAHGRDGWTHDVLEVMSTAEGASRAETLWIAHLKTLAPGGYNLTAGGEGGRPAEDLTGQRFGELVVVGLHSTAPDRTKVWRCRCECGCGRDRLVKSNLLRNGKATRHAITHEDLRKPERVCVDCGKVLGHRYGADPPVSRCCSCGMRAAWSTPNYRGAIAPSRARRADRQRDAVLDAIRTGSPSRVAVARALGLSIRHDSTVPVSVSRRVRELIHAGVVSDVDGRLLLTATM